jgi:hypothetical protein
VFIAISEQERGHEAERRQGECHRQQVGNAEEPHLGIGGLDQDDGGGRITASTTVHQTMSSPPSDHFDGAEGESC